MSLRNRLENNKTFAQRVAVEIHVAIWSFSQQHYGSINYFCYYIILKIIYLGDPSSKTFLF